MNKREPKLAEAEKGPQRLQNAQFAPANRKRLSPPALRTFLAIADLWRLTEEQRLLVLGYPSRSTYHNWCKQAREHGAFTLDVDVLARISAVLGIHQALGILFPTWNGSALSGYGPLTTLWSSAGDAARPRHQRITRWVALGPPFPRRRAWRFLHAAEHD